MVVKECSLVLEIPLRDAAELFSLEKTVCSHGLFMMSPNHWDPLSRTLSRPLRLSLSVDDSSTSSLFVSISHPPDLPHSLRIRVYGTRSLSPEHQESLLGQVVRMLRLSETDEINAREFRKIVDAAALEAEDKYSWLRSFGGRVFRSPTLFEDMVKCILLCNCQWPRTLSMAKALCELQLELQYKPYSVFVDQAAEANTKSRVNGIDNNFIPNTPVGKESKRKNRISEVSTVLASKFEETKAHLDVDTNLEDDSDHIRRGNFGMILSLDSVEDDSGSGCKSCHVSNSCVPDSLHCHNGIQPVVNKRIGNFPSPRELANLDGQFLAKRCNLGYRAIRIIKLARAIVEGRIPLGELEEGSVNGASPSSYARLADQLTHIDGFGPFTCANVLMCMGFYHVIPADSETVRHLKQVHAKKSTIRTVQRDVEEIYGKFAPFQFLAYWAELWHFYEQRFGKLSEMPSSDYKLITACNMRSKGGHKEKRTIVS